VNPSAAHLTPPRASTPAFFVADGEAALLEVDDVVDELSVPWMRPWTVLGAVVPETLAAAAWYMARVFDPSAGALMTAAMPLSQWEGTAQ